MKIAARSINESIAIGFTRIIFHCYYDCIAMIAVMSSKKEKSSTSQNYIEFVPNSKNRRGPDVTESRKI